MDRIFKALADPRRRQIIDQLRREPGQSLFQICAFAAASGGQAVSRQAVTQHLDMLEKAGLIGITWTGRTKLHTVQLQPLQDAADAWLSQHLNGANRP
ncbi:ArsR/SmtB family transcription factor [Lysobacter silvisoli]|nr:helix-turn-helix transcriptional regulator [Lysobacter silvisoli]